MSKLELLKKYLQAAKLISAESIQVWQDHGRFIVPLTDGVDFRLEKEPRVTVMLENLDLNLLDQFTALIAQFIRHYETVTEVEYELHEKNKSTANVFFYFVLSDSLMVSTDDMGIVQLDYCNRALLAADFSDAL